MSIRALTLRYHHPEREAFADIDDSELVRNCFKTEVKTTVPEPTETELKLQERQLELADFQLQELQRQSTFQQEFAADLGPLLEQQTADAAFAREQAERLGPIQEELLNLALEDLRSGGEATPEQIALINEAADAGIAAGDIDIERFRTDSLTALREELAPALGLRPGDTPILDRGARVAAEATRQGGQLSQRFREGAATARLNLPLAQSQILQAGTSAQAQLVEARRQFQDNLRQQSFVNRLNLQSNVGGLGLNLATGVPFNGAQTLDLLGRQRIAGATQTTSGLGTILGPLSSAVGAGLGVFARSSKDLKEDIRPIPKGEALKAVEGLDLSTWRYKREIGLGTDVHAGPMAEDMKRLGLSDGETVQPMDSAGLGLAAVQDLSAKVRRIEEGLVLADAPKEPGRVSLGLAAATDGGKVLNLSARIERGGGLGLARKKAA